MRRSIAVAAAGAAAVLAVALGAQPAAAAQGKVVVFSTEFGPLTTYDNPSGCYKLPFDAHVIDNLTDSPITIYHDPLCMMPDLTIQPGYGSHVVGTGSFSA